MARFLRRVLAFAALQAVILACVWWGCPRKDDHYAAASIDKRERLAQAPRPRVIVVGGSSASFGIDSRELLETGLSPVNMGHNRSLGLPFMLAQVRGSLAEGDVVIVSPEYDLLWGPGVDESVLTHLEYDPVNALYVDFDTGRRLCDAGLVWVARKLRCALHQVSTESEILYSRRSFDAYGDFAAHRGKPAKPHTPLSIPWPEPESMDLSVAVRVLDEFAAHCDRVGARCVLAFAPLRPSQLEAGRRSAAHLEAVLASQTRLPIVMSIEQAVRADDEFFDAGAHLTEAGARARSRAIVRALR